MLSNLVAGVEYLALLVLVAAMAWFGAEWAIAHQSSNPYHVQSGKVGFLRAVGGAVLVGAAAGLINYFWHTSDPGAGRGAAAAPHAPLASGHSATPVAGPAEAEPAAGPGAAISRREPQVAPSQVGPWLTVCPPGTGG